MNQEIKNKRDELKAISQGFKMLVKEGVIDCVNTGLANYYAEQGHTTLNSYKRWKDEGYQVKRDSKALLMWGSPKPIKKQGEQPPLKEGEEDTFYPLAYVFSNLQVEPLVTAAMKR